ncbi:hypothetical protein ACIQLK_01575 [Microbacterium sp. NPDC091382]|uniref:hypothetical protein n=1 Tax=Microbacterium sp. NPDC091382 TaxID=3364210 RepID=UPI0038204C8A
MVLRTRSRTARRAGPRCERFTRHTPAGGGEVVEAVDVAGVLAVIQAMLLPVVLEEDSRRRVDEIADGQEPAARVPNRGVHFEARESGLSRVQSEERLGDRIRARLGERERTSEATHTARPDSAVDLRLESIDGEHGIVPAEKGVRCDHEFPVGEKGCRLAPRSGRLGHRHPVDQPEASHLRLVPADAYPASPYRRGDRGHIESGSESVRTPTTRENERRCVREILPGPQLGQVPACEPRHVARLLARTDAVERCGQ